MSEPLPSPDEATFAAGYVIGMGFRPESSDLDKKMCRRAHDVLRAYARGELVPKITSIPSPREINSRVRQRAKELYEHMAANDPVMHCNRFPSWEELDKTTQAKWVAEARKNP